MSSHSRWRQADGLIDPETLIEDVLSAGVEALQDRDQADHEWLAYARKEAEVGFAALDRGEGIRGTVDEHMARIDTAVRARVAQRDGYTTYSGTVRERFAIVTGRAFRCEHTEPRSSSEETSLQPLARELTHEREVVAHEANIFAPHLPALYRGGQEDPVVVRCDRFG
jgi:hypothetical protein